MRRRLQAIQYYDKALEILSHHLDNAKKDPSLESVQDGFRDSKKLLLQGFCDVEFILLDQVEVPLLYLLVTNIYVDQASCTSDCVPTELPANPLPANDQSTINRKEAAKALFEKVPDYKKQPSIDPRIYIGLLTVLLDKAVLTLREFEEAITTRDNSQPDIIVSFQKHLSLLALMVQQKKMFIVQPSGFILLYVASASHLSKTLSTMRSSEMSKRYWVVYIAHASANSYWFEDDERVSGLMSRMSYIIVVAPATDGVTELNSEDAIPKSAFELCFGTKDGEARITKGAGSNAFRSSPLEVEKMKEKALFKVFSSFLFKLFLVFNLWNSARVRNSKSLRTAWRYPQESSLSAPFLLRFAGILAGLQG